MKKIFICLFILFISSHCYSENSDVSDSSKNRIKSDVYTKIAFTNHKNGFYKEAESLYLEAIELDPENYNAVCNLGLLYMELKEYDKAIKYHKKTIELIPDDFRGYYNLGVAYCNIGNRIKAWEQVIRLREMGEYEYAYELQDSLMSEEIIDGLANFEELSEDEALKQEQYQRWIEILGGEAGEALEEELKEKGMLKED